MNGINGNPFIDCQNHLDIKTLKSLNLEICTGIALSETKAGVYGPGVQNSDVYGNFLNIKNKLKKSKDVNLNTLTHNQQNTFAKLYFNLYNPSTTLYLREVKKTVDPITAYKCKSYDQFFEWNDNIKNFPNLKLWLDNLLGPVFEQYGRILFFIHEHDCKLLLHRDGYRYTPHQNEFLWLNPMEIKKFYVYDEKSQTKKYVNSPAAFFNDLDMHGGESADSMTWSLRIDGIFSNDFKELLGIQHIETY
jgi:hypothetical protein